jgi:hypothetical protein
VARYLKDVKANIKTCAKVLTDINETAETPEEAKARYDTINDKIGEIMEATELQCARPRKESLWSKKLKAAELLVRYWKARKAQLKGKQSLDAAIKRIQDEIHDLPDEEDDLDEYKDDDEEPDEEEKTSGRVVDDGTRSGKYINAQMKKAKAHLKYVRKNDVANRENFLDDEAKDADSKGDKKRAK